MKAKVLELKNKIKDFLYDENDPNHGLKLLESFATSRYIFVSKSSEDYMTGRKTLKRRIIAWSLNFVLWIVMFKNLFSAILMNKTYEEITGGIHYMYFRPDLLGFMVSLLYTIIASIGK
jgi:hypothetical protein